MKDWLEKGALPDDPELGADLTGVEYGFNARGEIQLEKKDDMKKRGLASPDIADAHLCVAGLRELGRAAGAGLLRDRVRPLSGFRRGVLVGR